MPRYVLLTICNILPLLPGSCLKSERIIGGSNADVKDFPYQLYLQTNFGACGASIISPEWALTAAHCLKGAAVTAIRLRAGSSRKNSGGIVYRATKYVIHEEYGDDFPDYDFGVIKATPSFDIGKPGISIIKLATTEPRPDTMTSLAGWGKPAWYSQTGSLFLKSTKLKIRSRERCRMIYGPVLTERMICASAAFTTACNGDSGGALVDSATGEQVGIVSFGLLPICIGGLDDVFSNVANQRNWIKNLTGV